LPNGSVVRTSQVKSGGGGIVIVVEVHRPNGLEVQAQMSNYPFGPEATTARSVQPLTTEQLTALALDPAFRF
jgi:hypothetical protein